MPPCITQAESILIVEDDFAVRRSLSDLLTDHGWRLRTAGGLGEARALLAQFVPAVCLLDLNLPDGSGLDLLRDFLRRRLPVRVIIMSAYPLRHLLPPGAGELLVTWMTKPVAPEKLLDAIQCAMSGVGDGA